MSISDSTDGAILCPIQSLQPEILAEIFTLCPLKYFPYLKEAMNTTLTLCSVCSLWRLLAIATPTLWRRFDFRVNKQSLERFGVATIIEHIHTWLGRSGTYPLMIRLLYANDIDSSSASSCVAIFRAIAMYTSRWETIEIDSSNVLLHMFPNRGDAPLLQTMFINHYMGLSIVPFISAPRLANLFLTTEIYGQLQDFTKIPWHQLTAIVLFCTIPSSKVLDVLRHCTRLESLTSGVRNLLGLAAALPSIPQIKHDTLRSLDLKLQNDCSSFFEPLILPALSILSLSDCRQQFRFSSLVDLFDRSHCKIEHLALACFTFTSSDLSGFLAQKSFQTLKGLTLSNPFGLSQPTLVDDEVLKRLTFADGDDEINETQLLQNLEAFCLNRCYARDSAPGVLGRMVLSRCLNGRSLLTFGLVTTHDIAKEDKILLKLAMEEGGLQHFSYLLEPSEGVLQDARLCFVHPWKQPINCIVGIVR